MKLSKYQLDSITFICRNCRFVKTTDEIQPSQLRRKNFICRDCNTAYLREKYKVYGKTDKWKATRRAYGRTEKRKAWERKWNKNERRREYLNRYEKEKRAADISFRLHKNVSVIIFRALKKSKNHLSWPDLVGYGVKKLKKHLEKQFLPGMSWDNYGPRGWHIDHIIPRAYFKCSSPNDRAFKRCWALKNLRPLWADENRKKGAKYGER